MSVTAIPCCELLSSIALRIFIILEKEQGKSRKGKNIKYAKGRKPITPLTYGSPLDNELSLLFGSVCHVSPKNGKKKGPHKKKIIIIITVIILNNTN